MHVSLGDHHRREHFAAETPTLSPVAEDAVGVDVEAGGWTMRGDGAAYQLRFSLGGRHRPKSRLSPNGSRCCTGARA